MNIDRDLQSIQEVRDLVAKAKEAEKTLCTFPQEKLDAICASIASACMEHAEELAKMAVQETGFGKWEDKVLKNKLGSAITWESVKNMKTVGVLRENEETKVTEIGVPMGVVAALIRPQTRLPPSCTRASFPSKLEAIRDQPASGSKKLYHSYI